MQIRSLNHLLLGFLLLFSAFSCAKYSEEKAKLSPEGFTNPSNLTKADIIMGDKDYSITPEMVRAFIISDTSNVKTIVSITPFPDNDEPALYVVNFEDGWSIYPTDSRLGLSLIDNPYGSLDLSENSGNLGFDLWIEDLVKQNYAAKKQSREIDVACVDIWDSFRRRFSNTEESSFPPEMTASYDSEHNRSDLDIWVKLAYPDNPYSSIDTLAEKGPLLQTKWGQGSPWNISMLSLNGDHCVAGCAPVAVAQVLYYLHNYLTMPTGLYHSISILSSSYVYSEGYLVTLSRDNFTYNSPRWNDMPLLSEGGTTAGYQYVSDLLLDVGSRLGAVYNVNRTGVLVSSMNYFDISPCKLYASWGYYDSQDDINTIIHSLNHSNSPVIMTAQSSNYPGARHTWVIDGYLTTLTTIFDKYAWFPISIAPPDAVVYDTKTEGELRALYNTIYPGMTVIENSISYYQTGYKMNWGENGSYDDALYDSLINSMWLGVYNDNKAYHSHIYGVEFTF